ncbi:hypothetical protein MHH52_08575 [Paenibacillus sp. FSL K6-0276]
MRSVVYSAQKLEGSKIEGYNDFQRDSMGYLEVNLERFMFVDT